MLVQDRKYGNAIIRQLTTGALIDADHNELFFIF
jgi:hypothetical protein